MAIIYDPINGTFQVITPAPIPQGIEPPADLTEETAQRISADNNLQDQVNAEAVTRASADDGLQAQIDDLTALVL